MTIYNFPQHIKGDTRKATTFKLKLNGSALDLTGAQIAIKFRKDKAYNSEEQQTYEVGSGITISSPPTDGEFELDQEDIDWPAGTYYFDVQVTDALSIKRTLLAGTFTVIQDITY